MAGMESLFSPPIRCILDVKGFTTESEVIWWPLRENVPTSQLGEVHSNAGETSAGAQTRNKIQGSRMSDVVTVMFMIPGNPGLIDYYEEFLTTIHETTPHPLVIYGVSHLGHSPAIRQASAPAHYHHHHSKPSRLYSLDDQIRHKVQVIRDIMHKAYNHQHVHVLVVGHSVGAYIAGKAIQELTQSDWEAQWDLRCIGLFPTLFDIAKTPNGNVLKHLFPHRTFASGLLGFLSLLPTPVLPRLLSMFTEPHPTTLHLLNPHILPQAMYMAECEMDEIGPLDKAWDNVSDKCLFYFSANDAWAPKAWYDIVLARLPQATTLLCDEDLPHAFVLGYSQNVAQKMVGWLDDLVRMGSWRARE
ncbi:hypothetical protein BZG36_02791 [Bifiguratus adelaidae]|uniref:AB hydrolase-1 domain-containing protein n=1 Tax=Bifiguratus adelaidae TaxID=1938954 RepID=A0A261Y1D8_9FUNG|nr:hypothetical protein BZG36_02791 [Bifiguratus adelaidae]